MTTISFAKYGWENCIIPSNLESLVDHLPTWKDLRILRPVKQYGTHSLFFPWDAFHNEENKAYFPGFELFECIDSGTYGKIYKAKRGVFYPDDTISESGLVRFKRQGPFHDIASKQSKIAISASEKRKPKVDQEHAYEEEIQSFLYEAALHAIVLQTFQSHGLSSIVPELYEVFAISKYQRPTLPSQITHIIMNMDLIQGETLFTYFAKNKITDELLVDILIQLCVYLDILQTELRFNHRDFKINNVLIRNDHAGFSRVLEPTYLKSSWTCKKDLVIIDFGFSCIACSEEDRTSLIQAGSWFSHEHECVKKGRDIALFLYSLQAYYPLQTRISPALFQILRNACIVEKGDEEYCLFDGISKDGVPSLPTNPTPLSFHSGVYLFLRDPAVEIPFCDPRVLSNILQEYNNQLIAPKN